MADEEKNEETPFENATEASAGSPDGADGMASAEAAGVESGAVVNEQIEKLQGDLAAAKEQNVRLLADFDNFRRRVARERNETYSNATEAAVKEFLPVIDNFERAIGQAPAAGDPFGDGIRMVYDQLLAVFAKMSVEAIDAEGKEFNPTDHEAIAYQPAPGSTEGTVIYQVKRGYRMNGKVIRPASVIVSSGDPNATAAETAPSANESEGADGKSEEA